MQHEDGHIIPDDWVPAKLPARMSLSPAHVERLQAMGYTCKVTWPSSMANGHRWVNITKDEPPTPLQVFDWAVVRQSDIGPGLMTCAEAFGCSIAQLRAVVAKWDDPRGHLECVQIKTPMSGAIGWRVDAYYNTSGV